MRAIAVLSLLGFVGIGADPVGICPSTNGVYVDFLIDHGDCNKFYKCDWGKPVLYTCPSNLHFNSKLNVCDWPENAGCTGSAGPSTNPPGPTSPTTTPSTNSGSCESVACPYTPGKYPVFHAHPDDCGRYCKCDNYGTVHDMPCPSGLHFNTNLNVCDWPEDAGCGSNVPNPSPTTTPEPTTTPQPTTSPTSTTPVPTTTPSPNSGSCASVTCPYTPGKYPVFHAHPDDCGRYCKCDNYGTVHDMPCPAGLHFNTNLNVCDWPLKAGCENPTHPVLPTTTNTPIIDLTTTTQQPTTTSPPADSCSSVVCPAKNGQYPVFHSHPKVCDRYCKCDWGVAFDMPCPAGLHFNPVLNVCDYPVDAGCPHV